MEVISTQGAINALKGAKVYNQRSGWFSLNKLWYEPRYRDAFYEAFLTYWQSSVDVSKAEIILYPEGLASSYGILPFLSILVYEKKLKLVIWKELGDLLTTTPKLIPEESVLPANKNCIIVQDVIGKGTTIAKIYPILKKINWSISYYLSIVQVIEHKHFLEKNISDYEDIFSKDFKFLRLLEDKLLM